MTRFHMGSAGFGRVLVGLAVIGLLVGARSASADDAAVRERVEMRLRKAGLDQVADIRVDARDGAVTLTGAVTTVDALRTAGKAALKESKIVDNQLRVIPGPRSDSQIREAVTDAILRYPNYSIFDSVDLGVQDGVVLLRGSVRAPYRKDDIESRVAKVPGVREIRNEIAVQSVSIFDDQLRRQLARAIYGDERFIQYANMANPPIHIVVDKGHVTLTGYVASPVEQALIGHIARGTLAFSVENRLRVEGQEPKEPVKGTGETPQLPTGL